MTSLTPGRRERKKAATRQAIADAALRLFLERGFERVSVRDVAEAADVSTTTLFKHFASKEALLFDESGEREAGLLAALRERPAGTGTLDALLNYCLTQGRQRALDPQVAEFEALVHSSPALENHARQLDRQLETALAEALASSLGQTASDPASRALARFVLEAPDLARTSPDPEAALRAVFGLLKGGWVGE